jgi:hypothetical protein
MGLKLRENTEIQVRDTDGVYYVVLNEDGSVRCHCGLESDAMMMSQMNPGCYYRIAHYPDPPKVVNVSAQEMEADKQLNPQNILPESELQPLDL